jgi:rhodanese-related sulfurtransferase
MKKIILVLLISFFGVKAAKSQAAYKNVSAVEFKSLIEKQKGVLIDLRTPDEIKKGKIKGATEIDFLAVDFNKEADKLDKSKTYYLYCAGGGRSADAAEILISKGFKQVVNLEKGFADWKKQNFEIEKKP